MSDSSRRTVFFVSDRTGITAETLGRSLLSQFEQVDFELLTRPFVDSPDKARALAAEIDAAAGGQGWPPIVFSTLVGEDLRGIVRQSAGIFFDFFDAFIGPLEREFQRESSHSVGRSHGLVDPGRYDARIAAIHYAMACDDGLNPGDYGRADVILVGASRSGKTPTCLWLALHYGVFAANFPLTPDELTGDTLPAVLQPHRVRLFGLTIDAARLQVIRSQRRPGSEYSSARRCEAEARAVEAVLRRAGVPTLNTTSMSVEEIAATIMHQRHLPRSN